MIRYGMRRAELEARIEGKRPGWLTRATERTVELGRLGRYEETASIWGEVKPVYMELQGGSKCAFCERKLESIAYGKGEQDLEHFRPKGKVAPWDPSPSLLAEGVRVTPVPAGSAGYFLLAYDVFNYSAACGPCNSILKRSYFPIAGERRLDGTTSEILMTEQPLLIYPIGDFDEDPESLIRFHGVSPQAVAVDGHRRHRALVTIEIFRLDDIARANLLRERAMILCTLFPQLEILHDPAMRGKHRKARTIVDGFAAENAQHANCARSFCRLYDEDPVEARAVYDAAIEVVSSKS